MIPTRSSFRNGKVRNISEEIYEKTAKKLPMKTKKVERAYLPFKMRLYSFSLPSISIAFCTPWSAEAITW